MIIQPNSKLVMIGDSITDCSRQRPVAEGPGLGNGYVSQVNSLLGAVYPRQKVRIVNMGCGGHTVRDLKARWKIDVLNLRPDWLSIMIGINDVWRQFDSPLQRGGHVLLKEYEQTLDGLVRAARPRIKGLVMLTPYLIEPNQAEPMRAMMDRYSAVVRKLAKKYRAVLVDTQAAMDAALKDMHPMTLSWDRVHPNQTGHMIIARAFLKAIGFAW